MGCWTRKARTTHSKVLRWSPWLCFWRGKAQANSDALVKMSSLSIFVWPTGHGFFICLFVCFKDKVRSQSEWAWLKMGLTRPWSDFTQFLPSQKGWPLSYEAVFGGKLQSRKLYMWGWGPWVYVCVWSCAQRFFVETRGQLLTAGSFLHFIFEAQSVLFYLLGCMLHS